MLEGERDRPGVKKWVFSRDAVEMVRRIGKFPIIENLVSEVRVTAIVPALTSAVSDPALPSITIQTSVPSVMLTIDEAVEKPNQIDLIVEEEPDTVSLVTSTVDWQNRLNDPSARLTDSIVEEYFFKTLSYHFDVGWWNVHHFQPNAPLPRTIDEVRKLSSLSYVTFSFRQQVLTLVFRSEMKRWIHRLEGHALWVEQKKLRVIHYPHLWNDHFRLFVVDLDNERLEVYDSLGKESASSVMAVMGYISWFFRVFFGFKLTTYNMIVNPMQQNGHNCGVFVCLYSKRRRLCATVDGVITHVSEEELANMRQEIRKIIT